MLKDHYLVEDYDTLTEHLEILLKAPLKIQECAVNAEFSNIPDIMKQIEHSIRVVELLNKKKKQREIYEQQNYLLYAQNGWLR